MAHLPLSIDGAESVGFAPAYQSVESVISAHVRKRPPTKTSGQGRPKGTPNKLTTDLKEMILGALHDEGGRAYLRKQAVANPTAFMALIGKVLPTTLVGDPKRPIHVSVTEEERRREVDAAIDAVFGVTNNVSNMIDVSNVAAEAVTNAVTNMIEHERLEAPCAHCGRSSSEDHAEWCDKPSPGWRSTADDDHQAETTSANDEPRGGAGAEPDDNIVRLPHTLPIPE